MSTVQLLRMLINERLTVAVEDILGVFQKTIVEYEEEIGRQRRLLDVLLKPEISLQRIEPVWSPSLPSLGQEGSLALDQEGSLALDHEGSLTLGHEGSLALGQKGSLALGHEGSLPVGQEDPDTRQIKEEQQEELPTVPPPRVVEHMGFPDRGGSTAGQGSRGGHAGPRPDGGAGRDSFLEEPGVFRLPFSVTGGEQAPASRLLHTQGEEGCMLPSASLSWARPQALQRPPAAARGALLHRKTKRCAVCLKEFCDGTNLKTHMRTHTGERPFACVACGRTFIQSSDLRRHMVTHTGETPFRCRVCGRGFRSGWNLKMHTRTHTGEKPHACGQCGRGFRSGEQLKRHARTHVGQRSHGCGRDII